MGVSLITTVRNEGESILAFLDSIAGQSKKPDEVVVVDGGSVDKTVDIIKSFGNLSIKLIEQKSNIARGRNIAIENAKYEIIAVTDAGCILRDDWVEKITGFDAQTDVIAGSYKPIVRSIFDACQYSIMGLFKFGNDRDRFVISSRSLSFRKRVWREIGGYPEWLNFSEDMYFHNQIRARNYNIRLEKEAVVEWTQRTNLEQVFKQFFRYMEGDGIARMHTGRHAIRFATYFVGIMIALLGIRKGFYLLPLAVGIGAYLSGPFRNFHRLNRYRLFSSALVVIPFLLLYTDIAKMTGYISGLMKAPKK